MKAPMFTGHSVKKARRWVGNDCGKSSAKKRLRQRAKRVERQAVRNGNYYLLARGQNGYDVA